MRAAIRAAWMVAAAATLAVAGCGGGSSSTGTGGHGGSGGASGGAGAPGTAGATGAAGSGAAGDGGLGGGAGLPACGLPTRPADPTNDAGAVSSTSGTCNTLPLTGAAVSPGTLVAVDGGARADGGQIEKPVGGTILDGDYEFVGWLDDSVSSPSRRELRVFDGGTYLEWAATVGGAGPGGADEILKYDTTAKLSGHTLTILSYSCGDDLLEQSYDYSAVGDELTFFNTGGGGTGAALVAVDIYRRTCARP